jgi:protein-L-isoaspartate(D-aspartate) O-methyltransferase
MRAMDEQHYAILRRHMVEVIDIEFDLLQDELGKAAPDRGVRAAMLKVPRHLFVPEQLASLAYQDTPLPIGFDKTISQPFIVALMTDLLALGPNDNVLEIGTGLGYQTAILAELAGRVWSVEVIEEFTAAAQERLLRFGRTTAQLRVGDGCRGWAQHAPYDKILLTAAAIAGPPEQLLEQLKPGGRMVLPIGPDENQLLTVIDKDASGGARGTPLIPVRFSRLETVM